MHAAKRDAYTLIELLVVISILAVLAAITVAFLPSAAANATEARAAIQLQGWLNVAKQRALRDQAPRGLRLWLPSGSLEVVECQYTEQPDDLTGGFASCPAAPYSTVLFGGLTNDLYNGYTAAAADVKYWNVQPGDYFEVYGTGLMHQITGVAPTAITITPPLPYPVTTPTPNYRIVRAPRSVGDETLKMPEGTIIDLQMNLKYGNGLPWVTEPGNPAPTAVDILFAPSGAVISRGVSTANIHLWVRAPHPTNTADEFLGSPSLLSVHVRTGFSGSYNISRQGSPYSLVN